MELTLKRLLEQAEFTKVRGRYDVTEVDDFLDRAAAMAAKVEVQLTQALDQAKAPQGSGPAPEDVEAEVERRVAQRIAALPAPAAPSAPAGPTEEESAEEVRRTIVLAQRTADAAVREAREDAEKLLTAAKERADGLVADAEARSAALRAEGDAQASKERREARQRLAAEITELEGLRESLRSDVTVLEGHVEEQRGQLGSSIAELQRLLDDPAGFRLAPVPALLDPDLPDLSADLEPEAAAPTPAPEPEPIPEPEPAPEAVAPAAAAPAPTPEPAPAPETAPAPAAEAPAAPAAPEIRRSAPAQPLTFDAVDHEAPGVSGLADQGPPTAPVSAVDLGVGPAPTPRPGNGDEDAFLAELRKAMADEEPLGPRDQAPPTGDPFLDDEERRGWRFGRRS